MRSLGQITLSFLLVAAPAFAQQAPIAPQLKIATPWYAAMPSWTKSSGNLTPSTQWKWTHDGGTPGSSIASSQFPMGNPSLDGKTRELYMSYSQRAGERFSLTFGKDTVPTHFIYDTWVLIDNPSALANLELDINHVISNGKTVILAFQCSSYSGSWEYGLVSGGAPHWHSSPVACNPKKWSANTWHHVQIGSHHDASGNVSYDWVSLDGNYNHLYNASGNGALALKWAIGDLNINFQLDGANEYSSSVKVYQDMLTIYHW